VGACRLPITCHVEQVCADGVDPVVPGERGGRRRRGKLLQTDLWAMDHCDGDDAPESVTIGPGAMRCTASYSPRICAQSVWGASSCTAAIAACSTRAPRTCGARSVWYVDVPNKRCVRVREGGEVLHTIELDRGCFACTLGGVDGRTLFLMAAEWSGSDKPDGQLTGQVLTVEAPAPGVGWP
jgi:hypothetical protein